MRFFRTKKGSTAWMRHLIAEDRIWRVIDAENQILGRVAQQASQILLGKHKPYRPIIQNMFIGDPVIIVNARKFLLLGRKATNHEYIHHTGYPGGLKRVSIVDVMRRRPETPFRKAVYNMLPRNRLRKVLMNNLYIYLDDEHKHESQSPVKVGIAHMNIDVKRGGAPCQRDMAAWWGEEVFKVIKNGNGDNGNDIGRLIENAGGVGGFKGIKSMGLIDLLGDYDKEDKQLLNYIRESDIALKGNCVIESI